MQPIDLHTIGATVLIQPVARDEVGVTCLDRMGDMVKDALGLAGDREIELVAVVEFVALLVPMRSAAIPSTADYVKIGIVDHIEKDKIVYGYGNISHVNWQGMDHA
jgi:hypothetical protein